jgi:dihydrodipicolinate synthase/N-acetylneuraminate lyase
MIVPRCAVKLFRLLVVEQNLSAAREFFYRLAPLIRLEFRAASSPNNDPHWLAVTRESALLRGIPVGYSRKPLSRVSREHSEQLKKILEGLGELPSAGMAAETGTRHLVDF